MTAGSLGTLARAEPQEGCLLQHLHTLQTAHREDRAFTLALRSALDFAEFRSQIDAATPAVKLDSVLEADSERGPRYLISPHPGRGWGSTYGRANDNPHFDTRMFIAGTSRVTGTLFGFDLLPGLAMIIPGAERFDWGIDHVNAATRDDRSHLKILVRFETADAKQGVLEYLRAWALRRALPMAKDWNLFIHDLNVHGLSVLLPNSYVLHSQAQTRYTLEFLDALRAAGARESTLNEMGAIVFDNLVFAVDRGTGFFTIWASQGNIARAYDAAFNTLVGEGISPEKVVAGVANSLMMTDQKQVVQAVWQNFKNAHSNDPSFTARLSPQNPREFWAEVDARRRHFEAVARLKAGK